MSQNANRNVILVVDDDDAEIELIMIAIEALGRPFRIDLAHNGQAALEYLHRQGTYADRPPGSPGLVILDNKMPVMNGIDALREIRRARELDAVPVVMFSASANRNDIADAYAGGVNSYVVKPMGPKHFKDAVHAIVNYWMAVNAAPEGADPA